MVRVADKGDLYVHQDANWNVIGLTDLGGSLVERSVYRPYGELTINQETGYGDRDGDGDVDATDKGTPGTGCTGTVSGACRILDLDFDGDYDSTDATKFDNLPQGLARHPGRIATGLNQPFGHHRQAQRRHVLPAGWSAGEAKHARALGLGMAPRNRRTFLETALDSPVSGGSPTC